MARKKKGDIKSKRGTSLIPGTGSGMAGDKAPSGRPNSSIDAGTVVEKGFGRGQYATERLLHPSIIGKKKNRSKGKTFTPVEMERFEELQGYASDEKKKNPNSKTKTPLEIINDVYKENLERSGSEIVAKAKAKDEARKMKFDTDTLDFKKDSVVLKSPIIDLEAYTVPDIKPIVAGSRVDIKDTSARKRRADISDKTKRSIEIEKRTRALQEEVDKDKLSGMTTIPSASGAGSLILPPRPVPPAPGATPTPTPTPTPTATGTVIGQSLALGPAGVAGQQADPYFKIDMKDFSAKQKEVMDELVHDVGSDADKRAWNRREINRTMLNLWRNDPRVSTTEIGGYTVKDVPISVLGHQLGFTMPERFGGKDIVARKKTAFDTIKVDYRMPTEGELKRQREIASRQKSGLESGERVSKVRLDKSGKVIGAFEKKGKTLSQIRAEADEGMIRGKGRLDEATGKIGKSAGYDTAAIEMQKRASEREAMRAKRDLTLPELKRERENSKIALTNMEAKYNDLKALGTPPGEAGNTRRALLKEMQKGMQEELENMSDLESKIGRAQTTSLGLAPASGVVDEISDQERAQLEAGRSQAMQTLVRQLTLYRDQAKASKILESSLQKEYKKKPKNGYPPAAIIHGYEKRLPKGYWKLRIKTDPHRDYIDVYFDIVAPTRQKVTDEQGNVTGWKSPYASRNDQDIDVNKMLELMNMARYPGAEIEDVYSPKIKGKFMQLKWKIKAVKTEG